MGIFDFLKKKNKEQKESENLEQVLNEIREENEYDEIEKVNIDQEEYEKYGNITLEDIKKNIENLRGDLAKDSDIICLKVLCSVSEEDKNIMAIEEIRQRLLEKYPEEKIESLFSKPVNLNLSFQEVIEILEMSYPTDSEMMILKALLNTPESPERDKSIVCSLEKMQMKYPFDTNICSCFLKMDSSNSYYVLAKKLLFLLGGKKNIISIDNCITRLKLEVKNISLINDAEIKKFVPGVLKPNKTNVQVIVGPQVEFIADEMKEML